MANYSVSSIFCKQSLFDIGAAMANFDIKNCDVNSFCNDFNTYTSLMPVERGTKLADDGSLYLVGGRSAVNKYLYILMAHKAIPRKVGTQMYNAGRFLVTNFVPAYCQDGDVLLLSSVSEAIKEIDLYHIGLGRGAQFSCNIMVLPDRSSGKFITEIFLPQDSRKAYNIFVHACSGDCDKDHLRKSVASALAVAAIDNFAWTHVTAWHIYASSFSNQIKQIKNSDSYETSILIRNASLSKKYSSLGLCYNPHYKAIASVMCNDDSLSNKSLQKIRDCMDKISAYTVGNSM